MKYQQTFRQISVVGFWATFFVAIYFTTSVKAQSGLALQGGSPEMNYSRELLRRADVQNELGLDAQQKEGLAKALRNSDLPIIVRPVVYQDLSRLSEEERKQWSAEIGREAAKQAADIMNERQRKVEAILRPDQQKRLTEIDLQWRGILALVDKSLSDRLDVSPEHYKCIANILADFEVKRITVLSYREDVRYQKRQVLLQETEQKVMSLLSDDEKARWSRAIGKPFKFEE